MKFRLTFYLFLGVITASFANAVEQSEPVGLKNITFWAQSDTPLSLPLHRSTVVSGVVGAAGVSGFTIPVVDRSGPELDRLSSEPYYLQMTDGPMAGMYYTVTANTADSITVEDLGMGDLDDQGIKAGQNFRIIPYWTLGTLFPNGMGFPASSDLRSPQGLFLLPNVDTPGIHLPFGEALFYYDGSTGGTAGWYRLGEFGAGPQDDLPLAPDNFYMVRNSTDEDVQLVLTGSVHVVPTAILLRRIEADLAQDHQVGFSSPVDMSLAQSGLAESDAFARSSNSMAPTDRVQVYDGRSFGYNPTPAATYFYFAGTAENPAGWYEVGNLAAGRMDDRKLLKAGGGVVVRKGQ